MPESTSPQAEPRNLIRLWFCVAVGVALWFSPAPEGLSTPAWHTAAVFAATIMGFLLRPLPMGPCVMIGLLALATTGVFYDASHPNSQAAIAWRDVMGLSNPQTMTPYATNGLEIPSWQVRLKESFAYSLTGFANTTVWLVVAAFLVAGAMIRTGLGRRIALTMISRLGGTTLGLGYAITLAELCLAPFIPSNTARGGGVMAPIVNSLSHALGSTAEENPRRAGAYLTLVGAHANLIAAAMFLTGMAANPLVSAAASDVFGVQFGWGRWILGALAPGLVSMAILPLFIYGVCKPQADCSGAAREEARSELRDMGAWTPKQATMATVLAGMLLLWATGPLQKAWLGASLPTAMVALLGVAALVVLGVERWKDVIGNAAAWDALIWLGGLVTMASALKATGFVAWLADRVGAEVTGLPPLTTAIVLAIVYFYSMYAFSMLTGHILAFAAVFFSVALSVGAPPLLMVALVAYFSNLCGCTTNYSSGPVVIYYGLGYVSANRWFAVGWFVSLLHLAVWLGVGLPYWKMLGWW
ncbi:DASS family sodium-coupled anion symporter [Pseudobythopirellula maris]|nr:DASS family sodium-coupled anion symporter [Pseudobythopirellula maris]